MKSLLLALLLISSLSAQTAAYPGAIVTDSNLKVAANRLTTALTATVQVADTVLVVASTTGYVANMLVSVDNEIISICSVGGPNQLNVGHTGACPNSNGRGFDGTTAAIHLAAGASCTGTAFHGCVAGLDVAWHRNSDRVELEAIETALGINLVNVLPNPLGVAKGGTGSTTQAGALSNILGASAVPVANGGTGSTTQAGALSNILGPSAVPVANGGTGSTTQAGALTSILGASAVPVANGGTGSTTQAGALSNILGSSTVGVANGGTGVATLTGVPVGAGTAAFSAVAAAADAQYLRSKPNQTSRTYEFATPATLSSADYNFPAQTPGGSLIIGSNVISLAPCPSGVAGTHTVAAGLPHYLYVSAGVGTAEAAVITGGTCTSGAATGTVIVTAANTHSGAWTIQSASSGIEEAIYAAGAAGAVAIPAGTIPYYYTITIPSGYNTCVTGAGMWLTTLSGNVATTSAVDGIVYDSIGGALGQVCTGGYTIGPASGNNTAGALVRIRYRSDGTVHDIYTANGWDGFWMERNARAVWSDINGGNSHYGLAILCNGVAYPSCVNEGTVLGGHLTATANTSQNIRIEAPTSGILISGMFTEGGGFTGCTSAALVPVSTNPFNEIIIENSIIDGCATGVSYIGNGATYVGNYVLLQNSEINASNTGVICNTFCQNLSIIGDVIGVSGAVGTDRAIILGGNTRNVYIGSNSQINSDGDAAILTQGTVTNVDIENNTFGVQAQPTNCFSFGGTLTHVNVRGNNFLGNAGAVGCTGVLTGSPTTLSMAGNTGVDDVIPAVTAAATTAFPINPIFTLTGNTAVGAVTVPLNAGAKFTFVATNGAPGAWTAGATIGNTFTPTQNVPVSCYWDSSKIWCKP